MPIQSANNDSSVTKKHGIKYGIAVSGGGFRSTFVGAGMIDALDSRSSRKSSLTGLLDAATHFSALSGGGWLLSSLYHNGFQNPRKLYNEGKIWNIKNGLLLPYNGDNLFTSDIEYYASIAAQIVDKFLAGYPVTVTDIYSHLLSPILFDKGKIAGNLAGESMKWSDIENYPYYKNYEAPYPILLSTARLHGGEDEHPNDTVVEITPEEFGSYDATLHAFAKLKYLGTNLDNNVVQLGKNNGKKKKCVGGYDSVAFITGTTSSIFDKVIWTLIQSNNRLFNALGSVLNLILEPENLDMALYEPNPFRNYNNPTYRITCDNLTLAKNLQLADGAFSGENVPLWPLLYKPRDLDAVFISDMSGDSTQRFPSGRSLIHTLARASGLVRNAEEGSNDKQSYPQKHFMPPVPDENSFINLGLTSRPTFFACSAKEFLDDDQIEARNFSTVPPLLIYLANTPMSSIANLDNFKMSVSREMVYDLIQNGFDVVDQAGDGEWPKCVACALIQRDRERQGKWEPTEECQKCFDKHCWDGTTDPRDYNVAKLHNNPQPRF